ncbi:MAG TPA: PIN domain-containing protein, partial [Candidatus Nanoarchaeia archaeon]|nr:PIN domain-containing protein [Candidatus Nanoarchaeia archaeon]
MIALDTTAIIDLFKGVEDLKRKLTSMREPLCATRMSYVELMFGIDPENKKHLDEERYYDEFFQTIKVFELDADAAKTASRTHWSLKQD